MEITIKEQTYKLKYTLRALFIFEEITGKLFNIKTITDEYIFFYCLLLANNKEMNLTFDDLISEIDDSPEIMQQYQDYMTLEMKKQKQFNSGEDTDDKKKE